MKATVVMAVACGLSLVRMASAGDGDAWRYFRGDAQSRGVAATTLPDHLELLWTYRVEQGAFETTAAIDQDIVFVADANGTVHALRLDNGELIWKESIQSPDGIQTGFMASPAVRGERLYVGDIDGIVHCLSTRDGSSQWTFATDAEIDGSVNFYENRLLVGSQDATLYCLESGSGQLIWKHQIAEQIRCAPTIADRFTFVAGCDGQLHVIDIATGDEQVAVAIDDPTGVTPAAYGDFVYFGTEGGTFFAVNWKQGSVAWKARPTANRQPYRGSPAVTEALVIVGGRDKRVRAMDRATGKEQWAFATRAGIDASVVIVGTRAFLGGGDGRVYGLSLADGSVAWQYEAGGKFIAGPAVAAGRLVIANDVGSVFCFGAKPH